MHCLFACRFIHSTYSEIQAPISGSWLDSLCANCRSYYFRLRRRRKLLPRRRETKQQLILIRDLSVLLLAYSWYLHSGPLQICGYPDLKRTLHSCGFFLFLEITHIRDSRHTELLDEVASCWRLLLKQRNPLQNRPTHCPPMSWIQFGETESRA